MRAEKTQLVADIQGLLELSAYQILITYKGLKASGFGEFRSVLSAVGAECHVVPNRLLRRAADASGLSELAAVALSDDTALVSGGQDLVSVAKAVRDFSRTHRMVTFKLAVVGGKCCSAAEAEGLADLPPREVLQAQLLGLLQAPAGQLVRVLSAKAASIVYVLDAYLRDKEQAA